MIELENLNNLMNINKMGGKKKKIKCNNSMPKILKILKRGIKNNLDNKNLCMKKS